MAEHFSLTNHLLTLSPDTFKNATTSPFLLNARNGRVPKSTLSAWLTHDRLYIAGYVQLLGHILVKTPSTYASDPTSLSRRVVKTATDALANINREIHFFEETAKRFDLDLNSTSDEAKEVGAACDEYLGLFKEIGEGGNVLEQMVLLWGTEICYLRAWQYATPTSLSDSRSYSEDLDGGALRLAFIPNWTNEEFINFISWIEVLVNNLVANMDVEERKMQMEKCEVVWIRVLNIETRFWPVMKASHVEEESRG